MRLGGRAQTGKTVGILEDLGHKSPPEANELVCALLPVLLSLPPLPILLSLYPSIDLSFHLYVSYAARDRLLVSSWSPATVAQTWKVWFPSSGV